MKSKKNRKVKYQQPYEQREKIKSSNEKLKIKFDVLQNDISCFINKNRNSKYIINKMQKIKKNTTKQQELKKIIQKNLQNCNNNHHYNKIKNQIHIKNQSFQLIKQTSNIILYKIQEKGIKFDWNQNQQKYHQQDNNKQRQWDDIDSNLQKSFASTNDYINHKSIPCYWQNRKCEVYQPIINQFSIQPRFICDDWRTTLMIRNIPNKYTISQLTQEIDTEHKESYDFLYLPCDLKNQCNVGYGFINFTNTKYLHSFYCKFQQYVWKRYRSQKICSLAYARLQGLAQLIEHFENSKVLNQKQKKYRPIIKYDEIQKMVLEQQSR